MSWDPAEEDIREQAEQRRACFRDAFVPCKLHQLEIREKKILQLSNAPKA